MGGLETSNYPRLVVESYRALGQVGKYDRRETEPL